MRAIPARPLRLSVGLLALAVAALALPRSALAAPGVITDPVLVTGADAIDPIAPDPNAGLLDATGLVTGAATKAALTSSIGFGVVQEFQGFTANTELGGVGDALNILSFTSPTVPDVSFSTLSYNGSGGARSFNFTTSSSTGQYLGSGGHPGGVASTIEFGSYEDDEFVTDQLVDSVGFMLARSEQPGERTFTVNFRNFKEELLSTQTIETTPGAGRSLFVWLCFATAVARSSSRPSRGAGNRS